MAAFNCEIFAVFSYSQEISYHELHEVEQNLMQDVADAINAVGGEHLDFWGYGDTLRCSFSLAEYDEELLADFADIVCNILPGATSSKLLCVDKQLKRLAVGHAVPGDYQFRRLDTSWPADLLLPEPTAKA